MRRKTCFQTLVTHQHSGASGRVNAAEAKDTPRIDYSFIASLDQLFKRHRFLSAWLLCRLA
jgi:hypothetical protein